MPLEIDLRGLVLIFSFLFCALTFAEDAKVAKVFILRGKVFAISKDKKSQAKLKKGDWVREGVTIKTMERSFVKFIFIDKSQMNLGPKSEMEIKEFPKEKAGILNLIKGKVRAKVTKNYMEMDKKKSKLLLKTKTAALGVRGTDFQVIFNPKNDVTALVTFEGAVAMAKIDSAIRSANVGRGSMETLLNRPEAVVVRKGQYSGVNPEQKRATIPVKLNPSQLETMESMGNETVQKNEKANAGPSDKGKTTYRSIVPPGVDSKAFSDSSAVDTQIETVSNVKVENLALDIPPAGDSVINEPPPEGFFNASTGEYAPKAGGYIDEGTGLYIPPPPDSQYDPNAGVYVPPPSLGTFDQVTGVYVPPEGYQLNEKGEFIAEPDAAGGRGPASAGNPPPPPPPGGAIMMAPDGTALIDPNLEQAAEEFKNEQFETFENAPPPPINNGRTRVRFQISIQ